MHSHIARVKKTGGHQPPQLPQLPQPKRGPQRKAATRLALEPPSPSNSAHGKGNKGARGKGNKGARRTGDKSARGTGDKTAHGAGDKRANEGPGDVGEAIGEKLVKLLSDGAAHALHSIPLPLLGAPDAELRDAELLGLDNFKLRPEDPARVVRSGRHLLVHIPLQVQDLNVTGNYTTVRSNFNMKGKFKARLQHLHIYTEIAICSGRPKLQTLEVTKMEGLRITSAKGMTIFLNWVLVALIDSLVNRNQARFFRIVRETIWKAFAMHVMSVLPRLDVRYISKK